MRDNYRRGFLSDQADISVSDAKGEEEVDGVEALDKVRETIELDHRGYRGPLGSLTTQPNDGPAPLAPRPAVSDKAASYWMAMQRAKSGTLMLGAIENIEAERVLLRGRRLQDIAWREWHALPSLYVTGKGGGAVYNDDRAAVRIDFSIVELQGDSGERHDVPFQMDFRHRFGPPHAPRERKLASMTEAQYKRQRRLMPSLHEERLDVPRGPDEKRPAKEWRSAWLRWASKVKCKGGPPPFNPLHDTTEQHERLDATIELDLLSGLMDRQEYQVFTTILENGVTTADLGIEAGFRGKQAEAVGLDRCRTAILAAIAAFEVIDRMEGDGDAPWLDRVPLDARLPTWLVKRLEPG